MWSRIPAWLKVILAVILVVCCLAVVFIFAVAWIVLLACAGAGLGIAYLAHRLLCMIEDHWG